MKNNSLKKLISIVLSVALLLGIVAGIGANNAKAADYGLSNPTVDSEGNMIYDCVEFGNYYQSAEVEREPIKWRVLSVDENNNAIIIADKIIDCKRYNESVNIITWSDSTLRSWLNGYDADANIDEIDYTNDNFMDKAFKEICF